jgi:citrate/tricarballylate utilization protein
MRHPPEPASLAPPGGGLVSDTGRPGATDVMAEGDRILTICNACRYCEGYCAVFPAMERRLTFAAGDLDYLANLCHNCGECYYACQYAPPHEFAVNVPQTLAQIRGTTWRRHAWPQAFAKLYDANALATSLLLVLALIVLMLALPGPLLVQPSNPGDFYAVMPHRTMVTVFSIAALYVIVALAIGYRSFCRDIGEPLREMANPAAGMEALRDGASLRYLHGGGAGCRHPDEASASARRIFHHLTFYGFMLCFAATVGEAEERANWAIASSYSTSVITVSQPPQYQARCRTPSSFPQAGSVRWPISWPPRMISRPVNGS